MRKPLTFALAVLGSLVPAQAALAAPGGSDDAARAVASEVLVGYKAASTAQARERAAAKVRSTGREAIARARVDVDLLRLPSGASNAKAIDELRADDAVAYAEPNWRVETQATATDPFFTDRRLWGMYSDATTSTDIYGSQAEEAWAAGHTGSKGSYVGIIDEGIQFTHPDLDGQVWTNPNDPVNGKDDDGNGYVDDVHGWDFDGNNNTIYDGGTRGSLDDHGTHVSGTIAGKANNGKGVVGMNWDATLISGKFLGRRGGAVSNAIKAVDYFTDLKRRGINVVATNNSWGGGGFSQALLDAIDRGAQQNILFVAAAGNSGTDNDTTPSYPSGYDTSTTPAGYDAVIAVAAISRTGALASFSQYGQRTVDLGAPGVDVWSTTAFNSFESYNGTSMATPHVTGAAALYAASHPGASATEIRSSILAAAAATPTPSLAGKTTTGGRLNVSGF